MFNGKKIKQLEQKVAMLQDVMNYVVKSVEEFSANLDSQSEEIDQIYQLYKQIKKDMPKQETPKENPVEVKGLPPKSKKRGQPKKHVKETPEAAK